MIRLRFVYNSDWSSKAIALFSRGWPSHVDAMLPDGRLLGARSDLIGGMPRGVQARPGDYDPGAHSEVISLDADPRTEHNFYAFLHTQIGKPYDWRAIVAFAFDRVWRNPDAWFCSELQAAALEAAGYFFAPLSERANKITPRDLLLVTSPWQAETR
ncbi:MAG: hypothetical protein ACLPKW_14805 [Acetobacteraceae bacterium]